MLTRDDKVKIIEWIASDGHSKGLQEDGDLSQDFSRETLDKFVEQCRYVLMEGLSDGVLD